MVSTVASSSVQQTLVSNQEHFVTCLRAGDFFIMHSPLPWLANSIWKQSSRKAWLNFCKACEQPAETQLKILLSILSKNRNTQFGKKHRFSEISTIRDYQQAVTVHDYQDLQPYIQQIMLGRPNILTSEPIQRLEPTSGTSGPIKYIPSTGGLRDEFQAAIQPWIYNLFTTFPECKSGPAYWFLSPQTPIEQPAGCKIHVGFAADADYLSPLERLLLRPIMVLPAELATIQEPEVHQYLSMLFLLQEENLRLLSLWNATSFLVLLERALGWGDRLKQDISSGTISPPKPIATSLKQRLKKLINANPRRSDYVSRQIEEHNWQEIWPNLRLISCWANSWAEKDAALLQSYFPEATLQPKGLLATEGVVTIPIHDHQTEKALHVAAVNSHFLEFEEDTSGMVHTLSNLEKEKTYSVLLTTSGGLYRYRLNDRVKCSGLWRNAPILDFIGKTEGFSDIYGEKLNETHVRATVEKALLKHRFISDFSFVAAHPGKNPLRYSLFYATDSEHNFTTLNMDIERGLCENYHYRHCRSLGQLKSFTVQQVPVSARQKYIRYKSTHGQISTTKFRFLEAPQDWLDILL